MASIETLPLLLKQLALPTMLRHWEEHERLAQDKQLRHSQYLVDLAECEANVRYQNRIARYVKESKLPPGKTLATFNFDYTKSINRQKICALADNPAWVKQANNLVIFGPSGVGKSHLAAAIGHRMIEHGLRCLYTSTTTLVQKLQAAKHAFKLPEFLAKLGRYPILILDDIGYAKKDETETSVLFELIADRYENASIIITANQPFADWDSIFPDNMMAVAAVDRLIHHATIINIHEQSYRKSQAAKN
jgi:DNA replication protein DnaC